MLAVLVASVWRSTTLEGQKRQLTRAYREARQALEVLEGERGRLVEELTQTGSVATTQAIELTDLQRALGEVRARLEHAQTELVALQQEHELAEATNATLEQRVADLEEEKQQLQTRFSSLDALKLAIRDVRRRLRDERWAAWRERIDAQRDADRLALASGNRGFVLRQGVPTLGTKTRLHVRVLDVQSK
jgi:chromosome segregation ATPase